MTLIRRYLTHSALRIIRLMLDEPDGKHTAYSVSVRLELQRSTIQYQLERMHAAGWISRREEQGNQFRVLYSLTEAGIDEGWDALRALGAVPAVKVFFGFPPPAGRLGPVGLST